MIYSDSMTKEDAKQDLKERYEDIEELILYIQKKGGTASIVLIHIMRDFELAIKKLVYSAINDDGQLSPEIRDALGDLVGVNNGLSAYFGFMLENEILKFGKYEKKTVN